MLWSVFLVALQKETLRSSKFKTEHNGAIVTFPACEDAVALEFVAQREAGNTERGEMEMAEVEKLEIEQVAEEETEAIQNESAEVIQTETTEAQPEQVAEQETEQETETAETKVEEAAEESETEEASCKKEEKAEETAAVHIDTTTTVTEAVYAYDTETGKSAFKRVEVMEGGDELVEGNLVETEDGVRIAEDEGSQDTPDNPEPAASQEEIESEDETSEEDVPRTENDEEKKKTAEEMIAELTETVKALAEEIKSLKEERVVASAKINAEAINPFIDSMSTHADYYDLLQPVEKKNGRDLL